MNLPVNAKIGRRVDSPSSRSTADTATSSTTNIAIHNFVGAAQSLPTLPVRDSPLRTSAEPAVLATPKSDDELKTSTFDPDAEVVETRGARVDMGDDGELEIIHENVPLTKFRERATPKASFVVDVAFLRHVINTLIANHSIVSTSRDLEEILSFFGEVELRRERQVVLKRAPKKSVLCGCSADDVEQTVEMVGKILVNGVNLAKNMPKFLEFLGGLGLSI